MSMSKMSPDSSPAPADDLRRTFATAIAEMQQGRRSRTPSQTPIFVRKAAAAPDDSAAEKRALTTAARALAQLWNVSSTLIR
jgi:hypothetical protein